MVKSQPHQAQPAPQEEEGARRAREELQRQIVGGLRQGCLAIDHHQDISQTEAEGTDAGRQEPDPALDADAGVQPLEPRPPLEEESHQPLSPRGKRRAQRR